MNTLAKVVIGNRTVRVVLKSDHNLVVEADFEVGANPDGEPARLTWKSDSWIQISNPKVSLTLDEAITLMNEHICMLGSVDREEAIMKLYHPFYVVDESA